MTEAYDKLKRLLDELFQFDRADLDFGIYRIMNRKREEVSSFLDDDLLPQVRDAFSRYRTSDATLMRQRLGELERQAQSLGISPTTIPEYAETQTRIEQGADVSALENEVYSDLFTFFRRYYKNGDFLSLRRYKANTYAIPYEGEEVKLHWANADQYYVKTTESFRDYRFRLPDGRYVHFRLAAASTERDNNKAHNGKERRFVLREETPIEESDEALNLYFEYRSHADNQKTLNERALERVFGDPGLDAWEDALRVPMPTPSNLERTTLEKHLGDYTARNSFDYFIHKDLGRFLRRELDFYLKNEVLHVDDLDAENANRAVQYLAKLGVIRQIGHKIIAFLAQIEDFQRRLFEKKKFVIQADYCLTLDNVPRELYTEIISNEEQFAEWEKLFSIHELPGYPQDGGKPDADWLVANPYLVLDTKFFGQALKYRLLGSIEDLEDKVDGLLVESENFQALRLLQERYRGRVKCIYIDPPYNTGGDGFLYKDNYQHSSWLAMMEDRLSIGREVLADDGTFFVSIDDDEVHNLRALVNEVFNAENFIANVVWQKKYTRANDARYFSDNHDHILVAARAKEEVEFNLIPRSKEQAAAYGNPDNHSKGLWKATPLHAKSGTEGAFSYTFKNGVSWSPPPGTYPRFSPETLRRMDENDEIWFGRNGRSTPSRKSFLSEVKAGVTPTTLWSYNEVGHNHEASDELKALFPNNPFANPKPTRLVKRIMELATSGEQDCVLDYFAGSGTTGHAVIGLNREDGGNRKYVLVEMGEYFDTVLKPRIQRVIYSKDWKNGKPLSREGSSHIFKYLKLEAYEDTLNNVALGRTKLQQQLVEADEAIREEYMLSYMLDNESSGSPSLIGSKAFEQPFSYGLKMNANNNGAKLVNVDMVETFNYLLGLTVDRIDFEEGFRTVEGRNPQDERVLVIWRSLGEGSNADLDEFFTRKSYGSRREEKRLDLVYVNGDNNLENLKGKGERWRTLLIEEEFRRSMFGAASPGDFGSLVGAS